MEICFVVVVTWSKIYIADLSLEVLYAVCHNSRDISISGFVAISGYRLSSISLFLKSQSWSILPDLQLESNTFIVFFSIKTSDTFYPKRNEPQRTCVKTEEQYEG